MASTCMCGHLQKRLRQVKKVGKYIRAVHKLAPTPDICSPGMTSCLLDSWDVLYWCTPQQARSEKGQCGHAIIGFIYVILLQNQCCKGVLQGCAVRHIASSCNSRAFLSFGEELSGIQLAQHQHILLWLASEHLSMQKKCSGNHKIPGTPRISYIQEKVRAQWHILQLQLDRTLLLSGKASGHQLLKQIRLHTRHQHQTGTCPYTTIYPLSICFVPYTHFEKL